jgi:adenylate kinase
MEYPDHKAHIQLNNKITQLEQSTASTVSSAVQTAKNAVGMGASGPAPRMVIMGPPGAGKRWDHPFTGVSLAV